MYYQVISKEGLEIDTKSLNLDDLDSQSSDRNLKWVA
jgi:hypothetical protein